MRTSLLAGCALATMLAVGPPTTLPRPAVSPTAVDLEAAYRQAAVSMRAAGAPYRDWAAAGRRFVSFDPAGTAVEALGDLGAADHVVVVVPGVATRLADFDRGLGAVARRAPANQARAVYAGLRAAAPLERVAVLAWLGYHPPPGVGLDAARDDRARVGASALIALVRGLVTRRPGTTVTLVGHSYGGLVVGLAAPHLPEVTDVMALGAPGMGASHASALGGARVWAALAPTDWIRRVPQVRVARLGHGRQPASPAFGARALPTTGVDGHDGYLVAGSATLHALCRIAADRVAADRVAADREAA